MDVALAELDGPLLAARWVRAVIARDCALVAAAEHEAARRGTTPQALIAATKKKKDPPYKPTYEPSDKTSMHQAFQQAKRDNNTPAAPHATSGTKGTKKENVGKGKFRRKSGSGGGGRFTSADDPEAVAEGEITAGRDEQKQLADEKKTVREKRTADDEAERRQRFQEDQDARAADKAAAAVRQSEDEADAARKRTKAQAKQDRAAQDAAEKAANDATDAELGQKIADTADKERAQTGKIALLNRQMAEARQLGKGDDAEKIRGDIATAQADLAEIRAARDAYNAEKTSRHTGNSSAVSQRKAERAAQDAADAAAEADADAAKRARRIAEAVAKRDALDAQRQSREEARRTKTDARSAEDAALDAKATELRDRIEAARQRKKTAAAAKKKGRTAAAAGWAAEAWQHYQDMQPLLAADFTPDMHPRGKDGKFIEKFGLVELVGKLRTSTGKEIDATGRRGRVESIEPDPKSPGRPNVRVSMIGKDGKPVGSLTLKPDQIRQAPEKARLDNPLSRGDAKRQPGGTQQRQLNLSQQTDLKGPLEPKPFGRDEGAAQAAQHKRDWESMQARNPPKPEDPQAKERRLAMEEAKAATDAELARQAETDTPQVWKDAIKTEQANRAKRRAADNARRQDVIDGINEDAAKLSTTDAAERAAGLDKILAKLRFSIIDTDKLYGNDYPPGQSGHWNAERAAQHEAMYAEVLANVQAAGIPRDRDALILGGLPGAGKSTALQPGGQAEKFGVHAWEMNAEVPAPGVATHVSVNPDTVKEMMVERGMTPPGISPDLKGMEQVTFLHSESAYLAKMFQQRLSDDGYNVVIDRTFESEGGMSPILGSLANDGYTFRGLFVDIPVDESKKSTQQRYINDALTAPNGGRFVPSSVQGNRASSQGNLSKNRDAFNSYVSDDFFDEWMIVDNTGITDGNPKGDIVDQGTSTGKGAAKYRPKPTPGSPAARRSEVQAMSDDQLIEAVDPADTEVMREYNRRFPPPPRPKGQKADVQPIADEIEAVNPGVKLDLSNPAPGMWRVGGLRVDPSARGKGAGNKAMADLITRADTEGATISLTPEQFGGTGGMTSNQLRDWYTKLGFVPNTGPGRLFETTDTMIRPPAPVPAVPPAVPVPVASVP